MINPYQLSPSTLAFVGDAAYELLVRKYISKIERPVGELHKLTVELVNANAQAKAFELIKDMLTEREMSVYKRGRNAHVSQIPKSSTTVQYHSATGFEALFGYLSLSGDEKRIQELFDVICSSLLG